MTTRSFSLQPGQPDEGLDYNPSKSLPYPIFVDAEGRAANVPGYALAGQSGVRPTLVGFTETAEPDPEGVLLREDWLLDPQVAVGMHPVFTAPGEMFSLAVPIISVTSFEEADGPAADPAPEPGSQEALAEAGWPHVDHGAASTQRAAETEAVSTDG